MDVKEIQLSKYKANKIILIFVIINIKFVIMDNVRGNNIFKYIIFLILSLVIINTATFAQEKKVLFLGNSYTAANDLQGLLTSLALSGGHDIYTDKNTPGGYTLAHPDNGHLYNQVSLSKIAAEDWDYVILQEQSQFPVIDYYRDNFTYPGAIELDSIIRASYECSKTMFYMTWGRKYGGQQCIGAYCSVNFIDYAHMQDSLASSYLTMSDYLNTPVCPVGLSWRKSIVENGDPIELFAADGSHPNLAGSYLAACSFYAAIFVESPVGLEFTAGLSESDAQYLQTVAAETVLTNLAAWNIDTTTVISDFTYEQNSNQVAFHNQSVNANSYLWSFGNGDTDTTANPVYTYNHTGQYVISLEAISGCKSDTSFASVLIETTGNHEISPGYVFKVYPNPASNFFVIEIELPEISDNIEIRLINSSGHRVYDSIINPNSGKIKISSDKLPSGSYSLLLYSNNKHIATRSLVLTR